MPGLERRTVLITGAGGFIGSAVTEVMLAHAGAVRALLGPPGTPPARTPVAGAWGEITDGRLVASLVDGADVVVHLAGPPSVAASFREPAEHARVHVAGTATVLEACRAAGVARVVYVSSAEVYGQPQRNPVAEDDALRPRSPYAAAKIGAERIVEAYVRAFRLDAVVLRPFSVYGPGTPAHSLVATLLRQATEGDEIVVDDLRPVRDYCYVADVADAVLRASGASAAASCRTYNVGSGVGTSVAALAARVLRLVDRSLPVRVAARSGRPRAADVVELVSDSRRARQALGWRAVVPLDEGLRRTVEASRREESKCARAS